MTCGIYKLSFKDTNQCYIGQSVNIEYRYTQHLYKLKNSTSSKKLQEAYHLYGIPELEILVECKKEQLTAEEKEAIEIFDSVNNGFNTYTENRGIPAEMRARGEDSPSSIYSNAQIVEVLNYLIDQPRLTALDISNETGVNSHTIRAIAALTQHAWLKTLYPEKYKKLEDLKGLKQKSYKYDSKARGINHPSLISPDGTIYSDIENVKKFCLEHGLIPSNLGMVLKGTRMTHKGWKLACQEEQV